MRKTLLAVALVVLILGGFAAAALFTEAGIFVVGFRFWMARAAAASTVAETDANLARVLGSTQYGVNRAESFVPAIEVRDTRIRLWRRLIALAPNDNWRQLYEYRLEAEYGKGPHAAKKPQ